MYKDFVNVTPESGGAGTTPIAVAADENEGAARSTSLNIAGGGVTRTVPITQKKMLVENQIEVWYWLDAATSGAGKSIYLEAYASADVTSNLKINFSIDQTGPTGQWETNTPVEILINAGDNASTTHEVQYNDYAWRFHEDVATITPSQDDDFIYDFVGFQQQFVAPEIGTWHINMIQAEPFGEEQTNVVAVYSASTAANFKRILLFNNLNLTAYDTSGAESIFIQRLQIQYADAAGQQPYSVQVIAGDVGSSDPNTTLQSGHFQNGVIDIVYTTSLILSSGKRFNLKLRIQGSHA